MLMGFMQWLDLQRRTSSGTPCAKPFWSQFPASTPAQPQQPAQGAAQHAQRVSDHQIWRTAAFRKKRKLPGQYLWLSQLPNKPNLQSLPGAPHSIKNAILHTLVHYLAVYTFQSGCPPCCWWAASELTGCASCQTSRTQGRSSVLQ